MRLSLIIASGRLDGPHYLEDLVDIAYIMACTGRMIPPEHWIQDMSKATQARNIMSML